MTAATPQQLAAPFWLPHSLHALYAPVPFLAAENDGESLFSSFLMLLFFLFMPAIFARAHAPCFPFQLPHTTRLAPCLPSCAKASYNSMSVVLFIFFL